MDEVKFTEEQQKLVDKLVGDARVKSREQAQKELEEKLATEREQAEQANLAEKQEWKKLADKHQARILELEPLEDRVARYQDAIDKLLKSRVEVLGDNAKKAVDALPGDLDSLEKITWLNENEDLFVNSGREKGTTVQSRSPKKSRSADDGTSGARVRL